MDYFSWLVSGFRNTVLVFPGNPVKKPGEQITERDKTNNENAKVRNAKVRNAKVRNAKVRNAKTGKELL